MIVLYAFLRARRREVSSIVRCIEFGTGLRTKSTFRISVASRRPIVGISDVSTAQKHSLSASNPPPRPAKLRANRAISRKQFTHTRLRNFLRRSRSSSTRSTASSSCATIAKHTIVSEDKAARSSASRLVSARHERPLPARVANLAQGANCGTCPEAIFTSITGSSRPRRPTTCSPTSRPSAPTQMGPASRYIHHLVDAFLHP